MSNVTFLSLGVRPEIVGCLSQAGIQRPTPVQTAVLNAQNPDGDLIVQARTGSGKTLAFGLTFLDRLDAAEPTPQVIVITPTRELAMQVCHALRPLALVLGLKTEPLIGGGDMGGQLRGLRAGAQLIIGTPGRIVDHLNRGSLKTESLKTVVLDEGDHMLDLGFKDELETILNRLPSERRTLLFSATMPNDMRQIAKRYMRETETITVEGTDVQHADIEHVAIRIPKANKFEALVNVLRLAASDRTMLFCRTRAETEEMTRRLTAEGFSVGFLHGELEQRERNRVLSAFRYGKLNLLVATEVAARGIDVPGVTHVINIDLPFNLEAYVHRSGRTGRAGQKGLCFSLVTQREMRNFRRMLETGGIELTWRDIPAPTAIREAGIQRLRETLTTQLAQATPDSDAMAVAAQLLDGQDPTEVLAKLLSDRFSDVSLTGHDLTEAVDKEWGKELPQANSPKRGKREPRAPRGEMVRFRVNQGKRDHWHPAKVVSLMCELGGITGGQLGAIKIDWEQTVFEVQADVAIKFLRQASMAGAPARMRIEPVHNAKGPIYQARTPSKKHGHSGKFPVAAGKFKKHK